MYMINKYTSKFELVLGIILIVAAICLSMYIVFLYQIH